MRQDTRRRGPAAFAPIFENLSIQLAETAIDHHWKFAQTATSRADVDLKRSGTARRAQCPSERWTSSELGPQANADLKGTWTSNDLDLKVLHRTSRVAGPQESPDLKKYRTSRCAGLQDMLNDSLDSKSGCPDRGNVSPRPLNEEDFL